MKKIAISIIIILGLLLLAVSTRNSQVAPLSETAYAFDTIITIQIYEGGDGKAVLTGCKEKCEYYESILSRTIEGSDIWKLNHAEGKPVQVHDDTARLISESLKYCQLSDGALDISMAPVIQLWNFNGDDKTAGAGIVPSETKLNEKLDYVNYRNVNVDNTQVTLPKGYGLDLGAVAKGYIADRLAEYMIDNGVTSAIINLGGNTLSIGQKPVKSFFSTSYVPFRVGIQKPFGAPGEVAQVVELGEKNNSYYKGIVLDSLVTSGTYQRYFEKDGKIYHHILSTENGMPVRNGLDSVTIHCSSSMEADALSTAVFCLGQERGQALLDTLPEAEGIFISTNKK